jgi:uncharacterized protein YcbK (DUF882 family)
LPGIASASSVAGWGQRPYGWDRARISIERALSFRHRHTGETLKAVYYADGRYVPGALREINFLFRDFRNDEVKEIDPALLDLLHSLRIQLESDRSYEVFSAYRSPETNAMLARETRGVARNSLHMQGMAIDIGVAGYRPTDIARVAWSMQRGGVGFYGRSNFVHVDVGPVRSWYG